MFKFKNYVFWLAGLLMLACSLVLFSASSSQHELLPGTGLYPYRIVKSADAGGSVITVQAEDTIKAHVRLSPSHQFPYANLNFLVGNDSEEDYVDWSPYFRLAIEIKCNPENVLSFAVGTHDPEVTVAGEPGTYRPSMHSFHCTNNWQEINIDLNRLNTPDWWLERYDRVVSDKNYSLEKTNSFSILHSSQTPTGVNFHYEIASASLQGRNTYLFYSAWAVLGTGILSFFAGIYQVQVKRLLQKKIQEATEASTGLDYEPLNIAPKKDRLTQDVLRYMAKEYSNPDLNLEVVTSSLGINRWKITEILRKEHGVTFSAYLTKIRLTEAARLLSREDMRVGEIGYLVGYKSPSYFNTAFKKEYGCTPNAFRRYLNEEKSSAQDSEG